MGTFPWNLANFARYGCIQDSSGSCLESTFDGWWIDSGYSLRSTSQHTQGNILHERDFFSQLINDIGILRMSTPATFTSTVRSICMTAMRMPDSEQVTATGWGGTNNQVQQSAFLKEVQEIPSKFVANNH